eukprot:323747-Hanusia_phi.AAC.1
MGSTRRRWARSPAPVAAAMPTRPRRQPGRHRIVRATRGTRHGTGPRSWSATPAQWAPSGTRGGALPVHGTVTRSPPPARQSAIASVWPATHRTGRAAPRAPSTITRVSPTTAPARAARMVAQRPRPGSIPCLACPNNTYADIPGQTECTPCPTNTVSANGSKSAADCVAAPGFYMSTLPGPIPGGRRLMSTMYYIVQCPTGTYSDVAGLFACKSCPVKMLSPTGSSSVAECYCPAGYYGAHGGVCVPCDPGYYADQPGSEYCTACPFNYGTLDIGSTNINNCTCPAGYYQDVAASPINIQGRELSVICAPCPQGTYKGSNGNHACTPCASYRTTLHSGSTTKADCVCASGTNEATPGSCVACPNASLELSSINGSCLLCPVNTVKLLRNPSDPATAICGCDKGYEGYSDVCTACPAGKYKDFYGRGVCQSCPYNSYSLVASTDFLNCTCMGLSRMVGDRCVFCGTAKIPCPGNKTSPPGMYNADHCSCPAGTRTYSDGTCIRCGTQPQACPYDMTTLPGAASIYDCVCKESYYTLGTNSSTGMRICRACPGNAHSPADSTTCICQEGSFNPVEDTCTFCGAGFRYDAATQTCLDVNECALNVSVCHNLNSVCINTYGSFKCVCPAGFYSTPTGCAPCPAGMSSQVGSASISQCYCPRGQIPDANYTCQPCPVGTYYSDRLVACLACPAGSTSPEGSLTCTCQPGLVGFFNVTLASGLAVIDTGVCSLTSTDHMGSTAVYPGVVVNGSCQLRLLQLTIEAAVAVSVSGTRPL